MDQYISQAIQRTIRLEDVVAETDSSPESVKSFCDAFAHQVVEMYLSGGLSWADADVAMNNVSYLMVTHCGDRVPDFAYEVYLAFDAGEHIAPFADETTRPLIEALRQRA